MDVWLNKYNYKQEFYIMGLSWKVMHMFHIVFTTAIVIIISVTIISVTSAVACKRYAKHRATIKHFQDYDTNVNNYGKVSKKRSSFDGGEMLKIKEVKDDKLTSKHSSQLHKKKTGSKTTVSIFA